MDGTMNRVDQASGQNLETEVSHDDGSLDDLSLVGDWLTEGQPSAGTDVQDDLLAVGTLAIHSISRFLAEPENAEAVVHVLDGGYRGSRDADVQTAIDALLGEIADHGLDIQFETARIGDPTSAEVGESVLPDGARAAIVYADEGPQVVLVSDDLGFRDMILVTQAAVVDVLVDQAELAGLPLAHDMVADDLLQLIRDGDLPPQSDGDEFADGAESRLTISVFFDGRIVDASMV